MNNALGLFIYCSVSMSQIDCVMEETELHDQPVHVSVQHRIERENLYCDVLNGIEIIDCNYTSLITCGLVLDTLVDGALYNCAVIPLDIIDVNRLYL